MWLPNEVAFNESLATALVDEGAVSYARYRQSLCNNDLDCQKITSAAVAGAEADRERELLFADQVTALYQAQYPLQVDTVAEKEKLAQRKVIFEAEMAPFHKRFPGIKILQEVNNAEIMQLHLYLTDVRVFADLFKAVGADWSRFIAEIRIIVRSRPSDPFAVLKTRVNELRNIEFRIPATPIDLKP